jgi:hypothetical protein
MRKSLVKEVNEDSVKFRESVRSLLENKKSRAFKLIQMKLASKISSSSFDSDLNFSPFISNETQSILAESSGKVIKSVDYHGNTERELQKRPGFIRKQFHYTPETATQRVGLKLSSKKRLRTIASKGQGFKKRIAFHMKLAWKRRKSLGLKSQKD